MAFCPNCGAQAEGRFCAKCGSALPVDAGTPPPPPPPGMPAASASAGLSDNMASALCYALMVLTGVLFLVLEPYNRNRAIRFHAFQAIFAWIAAIIIWIAAGIVVVALLPIPFIGALFGAILHGGLALGFFIVWLLLMYKAYNNERWVLPVIGPMAEKQA